MEHLVIYEVKSRNAFPVSLIVMWCLCVICMIFIILLWKRNTFGGKIGMLLALGGLLLVTIGVSVDFLTSDVVYDKYMSNDYLVVEGIIEEYEIGTDEKKAYPDRFRVDDVCFIIANPSQTGYGYSMRRADGGVLENGMYVRICYIPYEFENVIMKIEIPIDEQKNNE